MTDTFPAFAAMPYFEEDEVYPVTRITTGALGNLGYRVFVLQAHFGTDNFSWVLEKEQAVALIHAIPRLLSEVRAEFPELHDPLVAAQPNLALHEPFVPQFRVGSLALGYDRLHDLVIFTLIDARILRGEIEVEDDLDLEQTGHRIYTTRGQALLLSEQTEKIVAAGRPYCPVCSEPIDDFGHFCLPPTARRKHTRDYLH